MPGLLQEQLNADPWKIFVCCIFCNMTSRKTAEPYFWRVLARYPTPKELSEADTEELKCMIKDIGLTQRRTKALKKMSYDYLNKEWQDNPANLYGIGKYGSDAYYLFCTDKWGSVKPKDYALKLYQDWLLKKNVYNFNV